METLKEEEEELKRKVEQCKVRGHLRFPGRVGVAGWALFSFHGFTQVLVYLLRE